MRIRQLHRPLYADHLVFDRLFFPPHRSTFIRLCSVNKWILTKSFLRMSRRGRERVSDANRKADRMTRFEVQPDSGGFRKTMNEVQNVPHRSSVISLWPSLILCGIYCTALLVFPEIVRAKVCGTDKTALQYMQPNTNGCKVHFLHA